MQRTSAGAVGNGASANMSGQRAQVFHDVLGMREYMTINPLQNDPAAGFGGDEKSIVDQPLPMRADKTDLFVQNELVGDVLFKGHDGFDGQAGVALG